MSDQTVEQNKQDQERYAEILESIKVNEYLILKHTERRDAAIASGDTAAEAASNANIRQAERFLKNDLTESKTVKARMDAWLAARSGGAPAAGAPDGGAPAAAPGALKENKAKYSPVVENLTPATKSPTVSPTEKKNFNTKSKFADGKYDVKNYSYPEDLFSSKAIYGGNYAIFYINVSVSSKLIQQGNAETVADIPKRDRGDSANLGLNTAQVVAASTIAAAGEGAIIGGLAAGDKTGALKGAAAGTKIGLASGAVVAAASAVKGDILSTSRDQKRLKTAIALHIPNNLSISYGVTYSDEDTAAFAYAAAAVQGAGDIVKLLSKGNIGSAATLGVSVAGGILTNIALSKGPNAAALSAATGIAANPKKEQVFKGVNFRTFSFDYKFFPRSSTEASNVLAIIQQFKYHMHPEFKDTGNFIYIYPSEFDISYYTDGQENSNLHRHTSCVLTDMSINYTPNGLFSTFANGMPTQIDVVLNFRELALLTKDKVKDGL